MDIAAVAETDRCNNTDNVVTESDRYVISQVLLPKILLTTAQSNICDSNTAMYCTYGYLCVFI